MPRIPASPPERRPLTPWAREDVQNFSMDMADQEYDCDVHNPNAALGA